MFKFWRIFFGVIIPTFLQNTAFPELIEITPKSAHYHQDNSIKKIVVSVFVHGTYQVRRIGKSFMRILFQKDLTDSAYEKVVRIFDRQINKSLFDRYLMADEGLFRFIEDNQEPSTGSMAGPKILKIFNNVKRKLKDPDSSTIFANYLFGWSGLLCDKERIKGSISMLNAIGFEIARLKKAYPKAEITINEYGYSHGGNVCLYQALVQNIIKQEEQLAQKAFYESGQEKNNPTKEVKKILKKLLNAQPKTSFKFGAEKWFFYPNENIKNIKIDSLALLGVPMLRETWPLISLPMFLRVINFFSRTDTVQGKDKISTLRRSAHQTVWKSHFKHISESWKKYTECQIIFQNTLAGPIHSQYWALPSKKHKSRPESPSPIEPWPLICIMPLIEINPQLKMKDKVSLNIGKDSDGRIWLKFYEGFVKTPASKKMQQKRTFIKNKLLSKQKTSSAPKIIIQEIELNA